MSKSTAEHEKYGISYSDDENNEDCWYSQAKAKVVDENYNEKIVSLLNKEFVQVKYICNNTNNNNKL